MTSQDAKQDLDYLKSVAERGANAPLLGGRVGLLWTVLLVPTLCLHGLAAMGSVGIPANNIGIVWMTFAIVGAILSVLLSRGLDKKPGAGSIGNQIEAVIWPVQAVVIFGYAISIALAVNMSNAPTLIFNTIMPFAFAMGALSLLVLGRITKQGFLGVAGSLSFIFMILTMIFVTDAKVYFVSALGVVFTGILPNVIQMRKEPANV